MADQTPDAGLRLVLEDYREFMSHLDKATDAVDNFNKALEKIERTSKDVGFDKLGRDAAASVSKLDKHTRASKKATIQLGKLGDKAQRAGSKISNFARLGVAAGIAGLAAFSYAGIKAVTEVTAVAGAYESAFTGIAKTVESIANVGEDGMLVLTDAGQDMRAEFKLLAEAIPATFEELSAIGELGGQLGILNDVPTEDRAEALALFTEVIAGLDEATNLSAKNAALKLAQFSNIYTSEIEKLGVTTAENIENLANVVVHLGNTTATTEQDIVNWGSRIAGVGAIVGISQDQVMGFSAWFASLGIQAQAGGSSVSVAWLKMQAAMNNANGGIIDNTQAMEDSDEALQKLNIRLVQTTDGNAELGQQMVDNEQAFIDAGGSAADYGLTLTDSVESRAFLLQKQIEELNGTYQVLEDMNGQKISGDMFTQYLELAQNTTEGAELTSETYQKLWEEDAAGAFTLFLKGLAEEGPKAGEILDDLGLGTRQSLRTFLSAIGDVASIDGILAGAEAEMFGLNRETGEAGALARETERRYATYDSQVQQLDNTYSNLKDTLGIYVLPLFGGLIREIKPALSLLDKRVPEVFTALGVQWEKLSKALGFDELGFDFDLTSITDGGIDYLIDKIENFDIDPLVDTFEYFTDDVLPPLNKGFEFLVENWDLITASIKNSAIVIGIIGALGVAFGLLASPVFLLVGAITALTVAWEKDFLGIQSSISGFIDNVQNSGLSDTLLDMGVPQEVIDTGQDFVDFTVGILDTAKTFVSDVQSVGFREATLNLGIPESVITSVEKFVDFGERLVVAKWEAWVGVLGSLRDLSAEFNVANLEALGAALASLNFVGLAELYALGEREFNFPSLEPLETLLGKLTEWDAEFQEGFLDPITNSLIPLGEALAELGVVGSEVWAQLFPEGFTTSVDKFLTFIGVYREVEEFTGMLEALGLVGGASLLTIGENSKGFGEFLGIMVSLPIDALTSTVDFFVAILELFTGSGDATEKLTNLTKALGEFTAATLLFGIPNLPEKFEFDWHIPDFKEMFGGEDATVDSFTYGEDVGQAYSDGITAGITTSSADIGGAVDGWLTTLPESNPVDSWMQSLPEPDVSGVVDGWFNTLPKPEDNPIYTWLTDVPIPESNPIDSWMQNLPAPEADLADSLLADLPELDLAETLFSPEVTTAATEFLETFNTTNTTSLSEFFDMFKGENAENLTIFSDTLAIIDLERLQPLNTTLDTGTNPALDTLGSTTDLVNIALSNYDLWLSNVTTRLNVQLAPALLSTNNLFSQQQQTLTTLSTSVATVTEAYRALAEAIATAAAVPTPSAPASTATTTAPSTIPGYYEGGAFTVPANIPANLQGPTGGMLIEVHAKELVQVTPSAQVQQSAFSGVSGITNNSETTTTDNSSGDTFIANFPQTSVDQSDILGTMNVLSALSKRSQ